MRDIADERLIHLKGALFVVLGRLLRHHAQRRSLVPLLRARLVRALPAPALARRSII
jgi:hypothetical protein